jgi:ketosteroid isomerase-like protein
MYDNVHGKNPYDSAPVWILTGQDLHFSHTMTDNRPRVGITTVYGDIMLKKWAFLFGALGGLMMTAPSPAASNDAAAVAEQVEKLRVAMVDPTREGLDKLVMNQLSYGHSNGALQNKEQFIGALLSKESDFVSITLSDQTVSIVQDTAVVRHTLVAATADGGKPGNVSLKILMVWQKSDGKWKLLARQAVRYTP